MNLLQALFDSITEPAPPLHVGEAMNVWTLKVAQEQTRPLLEAMINQAEDVELKAFVEHVRKDAHERHHLLLIDFMNKQQIPFPPAGSGKPHADLPEIPPGVRLTDDEVANFMVAALTGAINLYHAALLQSLRTDLTAMMFDCHQELLRLAFSLKILMKKKGWLRTPPPYHPSSLS